METEASSDSQIQHHSKMSKTRNSVENITLRVPFKTFAIVTVSLPGLSLAVCFITGFLFRFDEVNETMCEVKNYIPSISAVTGITPQAYLWRTCIALHSAPRFAVSVMYYNHYVGRLHLIPERYRNFFRYFIRLNFWLNFVECSCLCLVAYITNRENYPIHEKIFVVFMVTSLAYMLFNTIIFKWTREPVLTEIDKKSYYWKKVMTVSIYLATAGLIFFFIQHRLFCVVGAFSMFSVCEYIIAYANMGYHITGYLDFKHQNLMFGQLTPEPCLSNGTSHETPLANNNMEKEKLN